MYLHINLPSLSVSLFLELQVEFEIARDSTETRKTLAKEERGISSAWQHNAYLLKLFLD